MDAAAAEIRAMPATELTTRTRGGELSPVEVTEAALAQVDRLDDTLHAFVTPTPDLALDQARRVADDIAHGNPIGPLAGVPVAIKDLIATRGIRTTMGSPAYHDFVPDEDDVAVERILAAGATVLGKTTVPEFGYSGVGHTRSRSAWESGAGRSRS